MQAFSYLARHAAAAFSALAITAFLMANALATGPQIHSVAGIIA